MKSCPRLTTCISVALFGVLNSVAFGQLAITGSVPSDGAIDARIPHVMDVPLTLAGWDSILLSFDGDVSAVATADFSIEEDGGDGFPPGIAELTQAGDNSVFVTLSEAIEPGAWTTITHLPSQTSVRLGHLPGDINGDGVAAPTDLLAVIDYLNGQYLDPLPVHQCDVDRSGVCDQADVQATVDVLKGLSGFAPWMGLRLPGSTSDAQGATGAAAEAVVELVPRVAGPYPPGVVLTVDVRLRQVLPASSILLRLVQFDFNDSDSLLSLVSFAFDFLDTQAICGSDPTACGTGYVSFEGLSDADGAVVTSVFFGQSADPNTQMLIPADGSSVLVGAIDVVAPAVPGTYALEAINAGTNDPANASAFISFGFGSPSDPITHWRGSNGMIIGAPLLLVVQIGDCNNNQVPDDEDIAQGTSQDCNLNALPDECDIAFGVSLDCNQNGVPDECELDSDGDGLTDDCDGCPFDSGKTEPGVCGCGVPDDDSDGDGAEDCVDGCPDDPDRTEPGVCGCSAPDTDGDGVDDCEDGCPNDPQKADPGICGCGVSDDDSDGDGMANCIDGCPFDNQKFDPGVCGCFVPDSDADGDGTEDCIDNCMFDAGKTEPGICGCGVPDDDTDGDGVEDCTDDCPNDPDKSAPGICGCGVLDSDSDGDGVEDCIDNCPNDINSDQADGDGDGIGDACDPEVIPAVSTWGLAMVVLLLLTIARLRFRRDSLTA